MAPGQSLVGSQPRAVLSLAPRLPVPDALVLGLQGTAPSAPT